MQTVTVPLLNKLKQDNEINSSLRLIAEWNHNRHSKIKSVSNFGIPVDQEYDNGLFPIASIAEPERPTRGIVKGWVSSVNSGVGADSWVHSGYIDKVNGGARYTMVSDTDRYKYWVSPEESATASPYAMTKVNPCVVYEADIWANKIYICMETSYAKPVNFTVQVTIDGTNWTVVATNPAIDSKGRVMLYSQADNSWSSTVHREKPQKIRGVRVSVTSMDKGKVRFGLIELGARIESDLSSFVESYSVEHTMSETSFIAPIGKASSNTASVTLDNTSQRFSNDQTSSLYYGLIDKNVEMRMDIGINIGTMDAPNYEWIRQFTMRTDNWSGQNYEGTSVSLKDHSEYLQSIKPNPSLYEKVTVGEAIWRILDSVGFSSWQYDPRDLDQTTLIPQFWTDGEKTVWEVIQDLAEVTQTAVYFDEFGVLQIKTMNTAMPAKSLLNKPDPVWIFDENKNGTKQADIVDLQKTGDFESNVVNVSYRDTKLAEDTFQGGTPVMEQVWEPEETVTLRSTQLRKDMTATSTSMVMTSEDAAIWPFEGKVQIEGEIIKYDAKGYSYYDKTGAWKSVYIISEEEKTKRDRENPNLAYKNRYNGYLRIPAGGRGLWNTEPIPHRINPTASWNSKRWRSLGGPIRSWSGGFIPNASQSTLTLKTNSGFGPNSWYICTTGSVSSPMPNHYGTRFKFSSKGYTYGAAGIVVSVGTNDQAYHFELVRTSAITANDRAKYTNELCFYVRNSAGAIKRFGPNGGKGIPMNVAPNVWYDMDAYLTIQDGNHVLSVAINGVSMMSINLASGRIPITGRYGLFTRGYTSAEFEYMYAIRGADYSPQAQEWWDRVSSGYKSGNWDREWVYGYSTEEFNSRIYPNARAKANNLNKTFDEFGPIIHEIREFDVKFTKTPVTYSSIYLSNERQAGCVQYSGGPFGAKFILANLSRDNAVISGEDTLTFGSDNPVDQKLFIYGQPYTQEDVKTHTVKDEQGIKRRGEVSTDIDSPWIQSESAAKALGCWICEQWSGGSDEIQIESFGNPVLQLLDVVGVNHNTMGMSEGTHRYFVVGINHTYNAGLETTYTLRRMKI